MKRTYKYAAMTKDEAQHSRMTFYEAVNYGRLAVLRVSLYSVNIC